MKDENKPDDFSLVQMFFKLEEINKINFAIKYLQDITDYIDAWENQISLKNSDFDIVCLKAYVQAKIDILKKERDGNHAN